MNLYSSQGLHQPPRNMLAADPGLTTGWVMFRDGKPAETGQTRGVEEFDIELDRLTVIFGKPDVVVIEDFRLMKSKALVQSGSLMEASQVIGILLSWARRNQAKAVKQPASILPIAQKWSKAKMPKNHANSHWVSALNHGVYYLVKNNMMLPVGME